MEIGPVHDDQPSSGRAETEKIKKNGGLKAAPAGDRVEISNEARIKLAALADRALHAASSECGAGSNLDFMTGETSSGRLLNGWQQSSRRIQRKRSRLEIWRLSHKLSHKLSVLSVLAFGLPNV
jgi:hypothetical protein